MSGREAGDQARDPHWERGPSRGQSLHSAPEWMRRVVAAAQETTARMMPEHSAMEAYGVQ